MEGYTYRYNRSSASWCYFGKRSKDGVFIYCRPGMWVEAVIGTSFLWRGWEWIISKISGFDTLLDIYVSNREMIQPRFHCKIIRQVTKYDTSEQKALKWKTGETHEVSGEIIAFCIAMQKKFRNLYLHKNLDLVPQRWKADTSEDGKRLDTGKWVPAPEATDSP